MTPITNTIYEWTSINGEVGLKALILYNEYKSSFTNGDLSVFPP